MKKLIFLFYLIIIASAIYAADNYLIGQKGYFIIAPVFQQWSIQSNFAISELSFPVTVYYPVSRQLSFSLRSNQANVGGDVNKLSGFADTQWNSSYHLEKANLVFTVGLNLPSGKKELSLTEFATSSQIAYTYYNFLVPGFGQGFNVSPGLSWAAPISDNLVLGLGATYQLKGSFKPLENMPDNYDPGDELLLTAGFDLKLAPTTTFAADFIYTSFGEDKMSGQTVFGSGDKIMVSGLLRSYQKFNELFLTVRYRSKGKNSYYIGGVYQQEAEKTTPNHLEVIGFYKMRINPQFYLSLLAEGRSFDKAGLFPGLQIFGFGLAPEYSPQKKINLPFHFKYFFGEFTGGTSITGLEIGVGITYYF